MCATRSEGLQAVRHTPSRLHPTACANTWLEPRNGRDMTNDVPLVAHRNRGTLRKLLLAVPTLLVLGSFSTLADGQAEAALPPTSSGNAAEAEVLPEPTALLLLGTGLAIAASLGRRSYPKR